MIIIKIYNGRWNGPKKVLSGKLRNRRPVEKPRTRWKDVVRRDTSHVPEIRGWRRRGEGREELSVF
jgi:hypothetical protein